MVSSARELCSSPVWLRIVKVTMVMVLLRQQVTEVDRLGNSVNSEAEMKGSKEVLNGA